MNNKISRKENLVVKKLEIKFTQDDIYLLKYFCLEKKNLENKITLCRESHLAQTLKNLAFSNCFNDPSDKDDFESWKDEQVKAEKNMREHFRAIRKKQKEK